MSIRDIMPWRGRESELGRFDDPFTALQSRMNTLFDDFMDRGLRRGGAFIPSVDVSDRDKEILVTAELPGLDEKDIDVTVDDNALTIRGEKKEENREERDNYYHVERSYGSFHRTIPLPATVDRDKVKASFKKGVLKITLPKSPEAQERTKKIQIEA